VFCQLDALRQCLPSSLRRTLAELPESLDETYERIVKDIKKGNRADAYRMLQCLAVAIRPLSVAELAEVLAFDFDASATKGGIPQLNPKWRWEDHEQAVLSTCSSLITIVPADDSPVVQFSHFSVKEFLLSDRLATSSKDLSRYHIALEDANTLIAEACLGFLLRDPVDENDAATAPSPLARYAAEHWVAHAKVENVASHIRNGMKYLFDPERPYFSAWIKLHNVDLSSWSTDLKPKIRPEVAPLYHAAFHGFHEIVERLALNYPQYASAISGLGGTALHTASYAGHVEVVHLLLKYGADVDARGAVEMSSLQLASLHGHLKIVRCLLDHGADPNFQDKYNRTPLSLAAGRGSDEIIRVLLEHDADANLRNEGGLTLIHEACAYGSYKDSLIQLLLEHGADPNARDSKHQTPLHLASSSNPDSSQLEAVRVLLAHGADVDAEDGEGRSPLQVALASGHAEMAQLLSEYSSN
jgi:hypothetical protein